MRKMVSSTTYVMSCLMMLTLVSLGGCSSPQAGVKIGVMGTLSAFVDALPPQVIAAANEVAKDMELTVDDSASTQIDGHLATQTAQGKAININVNTYGDNISAITIKVGTFGDDELSLKLLNAIKQKLAGRSRSATPPSNDDLNLLQ